MAYTRTSSKNWLVGAFVVAVPLCLLWALMDQMSWRPHSFRATQEQVVAMAFAPDSNTLAIPDGKMVKLWNTEGTSVKRILQTNHPVSKVAFSPDGKLLCSGGRDGALTLWNLASGQATPMQGPTNNEISSVAFSADGKSLLSVSAAGVKLWNAQTGKLQRTLLAGYFGGVVLHDVVLVQERGAGVRLWDVYSHKVVGTLHGFSGRGTVAISPDTKILAVSTFAGFTPDGPIQLWDVQTGKALRKFGSGYGTFFTLAFSPDSKTLASGNDGDVLLWDTPTGHLQQQLDTQSQGVNVITFSPDGRMLAFGTDRGMATIKRVK